MINVADVIAEYGAYYLASGQNLQSLFKKLYRPSVTASYFSPVPTQNTRWQLASAELDRVLQPFQQQFTPMGNLKFTPNPIDLFKMKVDKAEYPDTIAESWLGFLEGEDVDRKSWPFVRWMIEEHILPKIQEDYELYEVFGGSHVAPTPGTPGAAGTAMDGILKIQNGLITAGRITPIVSGSVPTTDAQAVDYIERFVDGIPTQYRKLIDHVFVSETMEVRYRRGKRVKYNTNYAQEPNLETLADYPNATVVGLPSHNGSNRIWASPSGVRKRPMKKAAGANGVKVESVDRQVKFFTDWYEGIGFTIPEFVFVNDQALPTP
jgi:hypothetical protein